MQIDHDRNQGNPSSLGRSWWPHWCHTTALDSSPGIVVIRPQWTHGIADGYRSHSWLCWHHPLALGPCWGTRPDCTHAQHRVQRAPTPCHRQSQIDILQTENCQKAHCQAQLGVVIIVFVFVMSIYPHLSTNVLQESNIEPTWNTFFSFGNFDSCPLERLWWTRAALNVAHSPSETRLARRWHRFCITW